MTHTNPGETWAEWSAGMAPGVDEDIKLAALREIIFRVAQDHAGAGEFSTEWANKKLAKLGIADRLDSLQRYELETTVLAAMKRTVYAPNRAEARKIFAQLAKDSFRVVDAEAPYTPTFLSGPEDADLDALDPDAPTTVDGTLAKLWETITLATIAGPHVCTDGANQVLANFGLGPVPETKAFKVTRPVEAEATTTVDAFDEESAGRVAGWRWEDDRNGYQIVNAKAQAEPTVVAVD